ncbi:Ig-like domain-containing protein [Coprococcus comes]|uniref:Bacterial Ig-like domain-containing protein n=1 Tax=Coprococcus comes TaxID=410072 RepID=A0A414U8J1_9FIRM|nr:Ig-like domain-containing protein [Coprococcus comes]RHG57710.1 hypothetical protein DW252_14330 [Coprococcus comes]
MAVKTAQYTFNGQTYNLTYNSTTGKWEATVTAPSKSSYSQTDHVLGGTVKATDVAGNTKTVDQSHVTLGASLKVRVKEKVAPVISITAPSAGAYITNTTPSIEFTVTDADSGVASIAVTLDGTAISSITKTAVTGGYKCTCKPASALKDGSHTISVTATDNDGNTSAAKTSTFTVDTVPPTLSITAPAEGLVTNKKTVTVTGKTDDATSKPVTVTVNGSAATVGTDGSFSKDVTLTEGANKITIIATDKAGKTTTVVRNVTLDTAAPVIKSITITPNPVDCGKTFIISVEITD